MLPEAVREFLARHDVVILVDNAKRPQFSISEREQIVPLQRIRRRCRSSKRRVLPNRWSTSLHREDDSPVPVTKRRIQTAAPLSLSPLGPSTTSSTSSSSPSKPVRRSSAKAETIQVDLTNDAQTPLKMPLRHRPFLSQSSSFLEDTTQSTNNPTALRMPVRRSSLKSSLFVHRSYYCQEEEEEEEASSGLFRQVLTMRRSSLSHPRTSRSESYVQEQTRASEKEEILKNESFASSSSSSLDENNSSSLNDNDSSSSDSSTSNNDDEDVMIRKQSLDSDSSESLGNETVKCARKVHVQKNDNPNNEEEEEDEDEEYRKYYQKDKPRNVTASTIENDESIIICEQPEQQSTKTNNALRRAYWKRLSLNHSSSSILANKDDDDDVKDIKRWSPSRGVPRRGSLNHMLYTNWKSHNESMIHTTISHRQSKEISPLQRKPSVHRSRRWSFTSSASTAQTVASTASSLSSLVVTPLQEPSQEDVHNKNNNNNNTANQKGLWWKRTRRSSLTTRQENPPGHHYL